MFACEFSAQQNGKIVTYTLYLLYYYYCFIDIIIYNYIRYVIIIIIWRTFAAVTIQLIFPKAAIKCPCFSIFKDFKYVELSFVNVYYLNPNPIAILYTIMCFVERVYFHPRWTSWRSNRQCMLGTLLP